MAYKKIIQLEFPVNSDESISVGSSAIGIAASANAKKGGALFTNNGADVYWRADGTDPTASASGGHLLGDGSDIRIYDSRTVRNIKFIRAGEVSSTIYVSHMG